MTHAPTIAVIGGATLARGLADVGFRVVTGATFQETAIAVNEAVTQAPATVVVADLAFADEAGFDLYLRSLVARTRTVLVVDRSGNALAPDDSVPGAVRVAAPASIGDIMLAAGYQKLAVPAAEAIIPDRDAAAAPAPLPQEIVPVPVPVPVEAAAPEASDQERAAAAAALAARVEAEEQAARRLLEQATDDEPAPQPSASDDATTSAADSDLPDFLREMLGSGPGSASTPSPAVPTPSPRPTPAPQPTVEAPAAVLAPSPAPADPLATLFAPPGPAAVAEAPAALPSPFATPFLPTPPHQPAPTAAHPVPAPTTAVRIGRGALIVVIAGSGGVGKTSTSIDLAKAAAEAGLRAVIVDANRGQPDVHKRMRIPEGATRTVYDVVTTGSPAAGLVRPDEYNSYRVASGAEQLGFAAVFGPAAAVADSTPTYAIGQAIDHCVANAEVTIVDTQIIEATHSEIFTDVLLPRLRDNGWIVGVYDRKATSEANLFERLGELVGRDGVPRSRVLVVARDFEQFPTQVREQVEHRIGSNGVFAGVIMSDPDYRKEMNLGRIRTDLPGIAPTIRHVLHAVTGDARFMPKPDEGRPQGRRGLMGWLRR